MSIVAAASQFKEAFTKFFGFNPENFFRSGPTFSDFDGPNVEETIASLKFLRFTFDTLIASDELTLLTKHGLNTLFSQLQNVNNCYSQLTTTRDQTNFQAFAMAVDSFAYNSRMFGAPAIAAGQAKLEMLRSAVAEELSAIQTKSIEIDELKKDVRTLITPAVAGTLSQAFRERRDKIFKGRLWWLIACGVLGLIAICATILFAYAVLDAVAGQSTRSGSGQQVSLWIILAVRTLVLLPFFAAFGFSFAQYRKERDFEEEYAHKSAVAHSLPNYGDLARDEAIRDQIVTAATSVIFASPTEQARKVETGNVLLDGFKEMVDVMGKAIKK